MNDPFVHTFRSEDDSPDKCSACEKSKDAVFHITDENERAIVAARLFASKMYLSDRDEFGEPMDDYGYADLQRKAFIAGAAHEVARAAHQAQAERKANLGKAIDAVERNLAKMRRDYSEMVVEMRPDHSEKVVD